MKNEILFDQFLNILFLRPENAFMAYRRGLSIYEIGFDFDKEPSVDISCGDGLFTFVLAGGEMDDSFDMFIDVIENKVMQLCEDKKTDIFDSYDGNLWKPVIKKKPHFQVTYGTDWKQSLLNKAKKLGIYKNLLLHDNNNPLPFEANSFLRVYTNSIYWVKDIELHIREIYRITAHNGLVLVQIKTDKIMECHPYYWDISWLSKSSRTILDRGRAKTWKSIKPIEWWIGKFKGAGFKVEDVKPVYAKDQVLFWHVGLRPIAHFLILLFNRLRLQDRTQLKKKFISYIKPLIWDVANIEPEKDSGFECSILLRKS